jgi:hypothetical protein
MSDDLKLSLTYPQANAISRLAFMMRMPDKIGDIKFEINEQADGDRELGELRKIIRAYSPAMQERPRRGIVGDVTNWRALQDSKCRKCGELAVKVDGFEVIDDSKTIEMRFTPDAVRAIYTILLAMAHPETKLTQRPDELEEVVWPLARMIGLEEQLREDTKLKRPKGRRLVRDGDPEWKKEANGNGAKKEEAAEKDKAEKAGNGKQTPEPAKAE